MPFLSTRRALQQPQKNLRIVLQFPTIVWASVPNQVTQGVIAAAHYLESIIFVPTTVCVQMQYENSGGAFLASTDHVSDDITYNQLRNGLIRNARSNVAKQCIANSFPATNPSSITTFVINRAHQRILGNRPPWPAGASPITVGSQTFPAYDWTTTVSSDHSYFYGNVGSTSDFDIFGVMLHEFTEGLFRVLNPSFGAGFGSPIDYIRYNSAGVLASKSDETTPAYASIDGGVTNLGQFDNGAGGGDDMDWSTTGSVPAHPDSWDYTNSGRLERMAKTDLMIMDAMGLSSVPLR